jgi:hypothetical protein
MIEQCFDVVFVGLRFFKKLNHRNQGCLACKEGEGDITEQQQHKHTQNGFWEEILLLAEVVEDAWHYVVEAEVEDRCHAEGQIQRENEGKAHHQRDLELVLLGLLHAVEDREQHLDEAEWSNRDIERIHIVLNCSLMGNFRLYTIPVSICAFSCILRNEKGQ